MLLTSHDYQTVHILWAVCMCLCVFIFNADHAGAFMFRELSDNWSGSEPEGRRRWWVGGEGGGGRKERGEVCRDTVELYRQMLREDLQ